jgi:hypothetical protein
MFGRIFYHSLWYPRVLIDSSLLLRSSIFLKLFFHDGIYLSLMWNPVRFSCICNGNIPDVIFFCLIFAEASQFLDSTSCSSIFLHREIHLYFSSRDKFSWECDCYQFYGYNLRLIYYHT